MQKKSSSMIKKKKNTMFILIVQWKIEKKIIIKKEIAFFMWIDQEKKGKTQKKIEHWCEQWKKNREKKLQEKKEKKIHYSCENCQQICTGDVNSEEREREEKPRI